MEFLLDIEKLKIQEPVEATEKNVQKTIDMECRICCQVKNDVFVFVPCGHAVACEQCCLKLTYGNGNFESGTLGTCPVCRKVVSQYVKVYYD